ncbi:potassium channel protein, partial [bacterium]|nr:potassium channel protein [bacterium]
MSELQFEQNTKRKHRNPSARVVGGRVLLAFILFLFVIFTGTFGYMLAEGWPFSDAVYMTFITMSTVGFSEVKPLHPHGRLITIFIILTSLSFGTYAVSTITSYLVSGEVLNTLRGNRLEKKLKKMQNHTILAGFGKLGRHVARTLSDSGSSFVVI